MKIRHPTTPHSPWIDLASLDMPQLFREHKTPKYRRTQPVYTVHPDGMITVSQPSILPGDYEAS